MKKYVKKHLKLLCLLSLVYTFSSAQAKLGVENYNLAGANQKYIWMPVVHYQTQKGMYAELRYNYEDLQTISVYGGKNFNTGNAFQLSITPMVGFSAGNFTGISLALNADAEWKGFYLSSQAQFSRTTKKNSNDFLYSWSELGYYISDHFFSGIALQHTRQQQADEAAPGFVAGLEFKKLSIPVYIFCPFQRERYFIVGVNLELDFKNKK